MPTPRLAYLVVGREDLRVQAQYALLSALAWRGESAVEIQVHSDAPERFAHLADAVRIERVTPAQVRDWTRPFRFMFRLKPKLLEHLLERHPRDPVALVDADTIFTGPVARVFERIGPGHAAMHEREYDPRTRRDVVGVQHENFRRRMGRARYRGQPVSIDAWMWNSGLVGLDPSHLPLVREWIEYVDVVFPQNPKPFVEQWALSWLLQRDGQAISETKDVVAHYYMDKARHMAAFAEELPRLARMALPDAVERVRTAPIRFDSPPPPRAQLTRSQKWYASVRTRALIVAGLLRGRP